MAYNYFCTECGQENSAETVLFEMAALLTQNAKESFNVLRFRMTQAQLESLIDAGKPAEDQYRDCVMRFEELMKYLSSPDSMDVPELADFTLDELEEYLYPSAAGAKSGSEAVKTGSLDDDILGDDFPDDDFFGSAKPKRPAKKKATENNAPEPIKAILRKSLSNASMETDENLLKSDLQLIYRLFMAEEDFSYHFKIKRHTSRDDQKDWYIDGFWLNGTTFDQVRICKRCFKKLFDKAGCAEHRVVSFIGETAAGKTSTILSLTHYAMHGLNEVGNGNAEVLWQNNPKKGSHGNYTDIVPELLKGRDDELSSDLNWFTFGVAPRKTEAGKREDAYNSTMLFQNKEGKRMILSLMDLPGELFNNGKVDEEKVTSEFCASLSSSAFIICFDATTVTIEDITNMTNFTSQMQDLRIARLGGGHYVPSMILFTMEDEANHKSETAREAAKDLYMLRAERAAMENPDNEINKLYHVVRSVYDQNPMLKDSFYAIMRVGAFGHMVPTTRDISAREAYVNDDNRIPDVEVYNKKVEETNKAAYTDADLAAANNRIQSDDEYDKLILVYDYNVRTAKYNQSVDVFNRTTDNNTQKQIKRIKASIPTPNQMDQLMQWILHVSGCLPCEAVYKTKAADRTLSSYYIANYQYRSVNPGSHSLIPGQAASTVSANSGKDADLDEAMARNLLFINPGKWDTALLRSLNNNEEGKGLGKLVTGLFGSSIEGSTANIRSLMKKAPESN